MLQLVHLRFLRLVKNRENDKKDKPNEESDYDWQGTANPAHAHTAGDLLVLIISVFNILLDVHFMILWRGRLQAWIITDADFPSLV